jgi:3-oxoacyl-[acyl-carrier-protein] synthase II
MTGRREVVITGAGAVTAFGAGVEPLAAALGRGVTRLAPVEPLPRLPRERGGATLAALVPEVALAEWLPPMVARRLSPPSRWAVAAAKMALAGGGLGGGLGGGPVEDAGADPDPATAVALATSYGPMSFTQRLLDQILVEGPEAASPLLFTECVANAPAAQVAIQCRAAGRNHTICQREAGALIALGRGAADVASGRAERALVGAAEEVTPLTFAVLDRFHALARPRRCGAEVVEPEAARPFDRRRNGFVIADGACVLLLEAAAAAAARGAVPLARVRAWGGAFDPTAGRSGWGTGAEGLARELAAFLDRAEVTPGEIDRIVSGASGAVAGDRLEAAVLRRVWPGAALPPVLAPKAVTGEYGGGFPVAAVLAAAGRRFGPVPGFAEPDPGLGVVPHDGSPLPPPRRLLVTALAAGGSVAWVILDAV